MTIDSDDHIVIWSWDLMVPWGPVLIIFWDNCSPALPINNRLSTAVGPMCFDHHCSSKLVWPLMLPCPLCFGLFFLECIIVGTALSFGRPFWVPISYAATRCFPPPALWGWVCMWLVQVGPAHSPDLVGLYPRFFLADCSIFLWMCAPPLTICPY